MTDTNWTAGPYEAYPYRDDKINLRWMILDSYGVEIGPLAAGFDYDEAHLFAAAPELYHALKESLHFMETAGVGPPRYVVSISRRALAKAIGESDDYKLLD